MGNENNNRENEHSATHGRHHTHSNKIEYRHGNGKLSNVDPTIISSRPNPYRWPQFYMNFGMNYVFNGAPLRSDPVKADPFTHARKLRAFPVREDDTFLLTFPKSGTHWMSEIVSMLLRGDVKYSEKDKTGSQIEYVDDFDSLASLKTPRFFNTHRYLAHLPIGIAEKRCKLVHIIRSPKDHAVSWYFHLKRVPGAFDFSFDEFLRGYTADDYCTFGHQFEYLRQISEFEKANPGHPIHHIHYEDLKLKPLTVLQDLAHFLGVSATDEFLLNVNEACSFDNLQTARVNDKNDAVHKGIFRSGVIGSWKHTFTVAQNEYFEEFVRQQKERGCAFTFREPWLQC